MLVLIKYLENCMSANLVLKAFSQFCESSTGDPTCWEGNAATYKWSLGKTKNDTVNGVVRKLGGIDSTGTKIWVVAGSFKIKSDGTILRFVGAPKRIQAIIQTMIGTVEKVVVE